MNQLPALRNDTVIARLERAYAALAEADIPTAKAIADAAEAAEIYAGRRKLGEQVEHQAHAIKIEALRKLGELLKDAPKNAGSQGQLNGKDSSGGTKTVPPENSVDFSKEIQIPTLAELGVDKKTSAMAQKLAALPEKDFAAVRDGHEAIGKAIAAVGGNKKKPPKQPSAPKVDPRDAEIAKLSKTVEELTEEKSDLADTARIAEDKVQALEATEPDEQQKLIMELQKKIQRKDGEIARLTAERNRLNDKCNQLIRQVKALQKGRD